MMIVTAWNIWRSKPNVIIGTILKKIFGRTKLDIGDAMIGFNERKNVRFVHALTECEIRSLARETGLTIERLERIPRPSGEENFFVMLRT